MFAMGLVRRWQDRCQHNPENVTADILEACFSGTQVQYCNRCAAMRIVHEGRDGRRHIGDWRTLIPDTMFAGNFDPHKLGGRLSGGDLMGRPER